MAVGHPAPPFRWNVRRREQLGRLLAGWEPSVADEYLTKVLGCASRVVAFCADGDLHFVGRSPDSIFDLLSGVLAGTSWEGRLRQLPVSVRLGPDLGRRTLARLTLREYLAALELTPRQINGRPRLTVLVDFVDTGGTYGEFVSTRSTSGGGRRGVPPLLEHDILDRNDSCPEPPRSHSLNANLP